MLRQFMCVAMAGVAGVFALLAGGCGAGLGGGNQAAARLENSPRHHEWVDIKMEGGRTLRAYVAYPEVDRPVPAVVVIHENRGLNEWARSVTDQVAEAGYVAVAPDFLSGTGPGGGGTDKYADSDAAREGIYKLSPEQVTRDLDAAVKYARDLKATTDTVAVAGFCWGGGQAFRYATSDPQIAAAFVFYGPAPDAEQLKNVSVPVYGFYGGNDARITSAVPETQKKLKELGKTYEPVVYEGAGHGFMRSGEEADADAANKKGREAAWQRWKKLLGSLK